VSLITRVDDVTALIECCLTHTIDRLILYPENLTDAFFDLSSGEAGAVLQALRNYRIRLAVVRTPALQVSSRFGEMQEDERRGPYFRVFDTRSSAEQWLCDG
jgi:hypothetical protein